MMGAAYMVAAAALFAILNGFVRWAADLGAHPFQIGFLRSLFAAAFLVPLVWPEIAREGVRYFRVSRPWAYLARGMAATLGVLFFMTAISLLPLAEVTAISFTAPLFATIGSALILRETVRARRWTAILVGFVGVLVILRPGVEALQPGALAAVGAALAMAAAALLIKSLTRTEPSQKIVFLTSLLLTVTTLVPALVTWQPMSTILWVIGLALGFFGALGQYCLTKSFESADASVVLPFDYSRLPFAAAVGFVAFGQTSDWITWAGAIVIAGAAFYVARREQQLAKR